MLFSNLYRDNVTIFYHEGNCSETVFQSWLILYLVDSFCLAIKQDVCMFWSLKMNAGYYAKKLIELFCMYYVFAIQMCLAK